MVGAMQQIEQTGGIADIEAFRGAVLSTRDQVVRKIENEMAASQTHVYSPEEYNQVRARVNEQADAYVALLDNQDLTSILSRNRARLADLVEIAGVQLAPDLAILAPFGETVVRSYMDMMTISGGDPRKIAELMKADPTKAFVGNLVLDGASIAASLKGIAEGNLGNLIETGEVDKDTAKAVLVDQANGIANGKDSDIPMSKIIQGLSDSEMPKTAVSLVAKAPRTAFSEQSEQERQVTVDNFTRTQDQEVESLQRALAGGEYQLSHDGQEFVIVDVQGRALRDIVPTAPITFANEAAERNYTNQALARDAGVSDALSYINKTLMPVTSDVRWAALMGHEDGNAWASDLINKVNFGALANDVGNADNPILGGLGLREQGALRAAFRAGDVERAIEILGGTGGTGGLGAQVTGVSSGRDLTDVSQPILRDGATDPAGFPILTQAGADTLGFEGFRPKVYLDPAGIRTIGYGHNLEAQPLTAEDKQALGLDPNIADDDIVLTEQQGQDLYRRDVRKIMPDISSKVPNFSELPRGAQRAIADMAFNMGVAGVVGFKDMIKALKDKDYDAAADAMLDSNYAKGWVRGKDGKVIKDEDGNPKVFKGLVDRARINAERMRGR
jgi:lysozyme